MSRQLSEHDLVMTAKAGYDSRHPEGPAWEDRDPDTHRRYTEVASAAVREAIYRMDIKEFVQKRDTRKALAIALRRFRFQRMPSAPDFDSVPEKDQKYWFNEADAIMEEFHVVPRVKDE